MATQLQQEPVQVIETYLEKVRLQLLDLAGEERDGLLAEARARIELELELSPGTVEGEEGLQHIIHRLGDPVTFAGRLRRAAPATEVTAPEPLQTTGLANCRGCRAQVANEARICPHCGVQFPARQQWNGTGREYKSKTTIAGWPLVHIAYGRDAMGNLRIAKGVVAIGQFGIGAITIAQFGIGFLFGLGQFVVAPLAIGQFAAGLVAVGQFGFGLLYGAGMIASGAVAQGLFKIGNWLGR